MTTTEASARTRLRMRSLFGSEAAQKLLAFAALIVIFIFWTTVAPRGRGCRPELRLFGLSGEYR